VFVTFIDKWSQIHERVNGRFGQSKNCVNYQDDKCQF
jgi:hypothetical protein